MKQHLIFRCGKRQAQLLIELEKQAIVCLNRENGYWMRGALSCRIAKDLLLPTDKTIDEQINDLEPDVLRLEKEAGKRGIKLSGGARDKLNGLYKLKNIN